MNGPELISSKTGQSEQFIRQLFEQAVQLQPSLVFIDQLEIVASKSSEQREFEKRISSQLQNQLDSVKGNRVIVIGATSKASQLDPSLRRPGRFDVEIDVLIPNRSQREQILQKYLVNQTAQQIQEIASLTSGYVPADIF